MESGIDIPAGQGDECSASARFSGKDGGKSARPGPFDYPTGSGQKGDRTGDFRFGHGHDLVNKRPGKGECLASYT